MNLISLKEASKISGRPERTLRDWIKKSIIKDYRPEGQTKVPIVIDVTELRTHLSKMSTPPSMDTYTVANIDDNIVVNLLKEQNNTLKEQIVWLERMVEDVKREKEQLRFELSDARKVIDNLQKELIGRKGIKGLLKAFWP